MPPYRWWPPPGVLAAVQMTAFVTVAGAVRPGYDSGRNWVSQLSLGPGGWLAAVNLAVCGGWLLLCAAGLRRRLGPSGADRLVGWCGACLVAVAVVPTDPGLGYPPGVPTASTLVGALHQVIGLALGVTGTVAAALLGRRLPGVRWAAPAGSAVAAVMAVTFGAGTVLVLLDAAGILPGTPSGLLERVALCTGLGWIGVVDVCSRVPQERH
jgi:hypothetical protein